MKVVFRVDASRRIGSGHVVRCITLADRLTRLGAHCEFVTRQHPGHMGDIIKASGYDLGLLPPPEGQPAISEGSADEYENWLGVSQQEDADQTLRNIDGSVDWLIVDHYALDHVWEGQLRTCAKRIAVIDDLANRRHDCDLLLDQNYFKDAEARYQSLTPANCTRLCGPRYALLQPVYRTNPSHRTKKFPPERILVFYGGSDLSGETARAIRVVSQPPFLDVDLNVVVGPANPAREEIEKLCSRRDRTSVHTGLKSLAGLIADSDLALGAGGTSTWERCALGLPSVITPVAENQLPVTQELVDRDLAYTAGDWRTVDDERLRLTLLEVWSDAERYAAMAIASREMTDGLGTERVATILMSENPGVQRVEHCTKPG